MSKKYFKVRGVGTILAVDDQVEVGQGKNAALLIDQYTKRPDYYIPCDAKGKPLDAPKATGRSKAGKSEESGAKEQSEAPKTADK